MSTLTEAAGSDRRKEIKELAKELGELNDRSVSLRKSLYLSIRAANASNDKELKKDINSLDKRYINKITRGYGSDLQNSVLAKLANLK